jgi:hypothetical protein
VAVYEVWVDRLASISLFQQLTKRFGGLLVRTLARRVLISSRHSIFYGSNSDQLRRVVWLEGVDGIAEVSSGRLAEEMIILKYHDRMNPQVSKLPNTMQH